MEKQEFGVERDLSILGMNGIRDSLGNDIIPSLIRHSGSEWYVSIAGNGKHPDLFDLLRALAGDLPEPLATDMREAGLRVEWENYESNAGAPQDKKLGRAMGWRVPKDAADDSRIRHSAKLIWSNAGTYERQEARVYLTEIFDNGIEDGETALALSLPNFVGRMQVDPDTFRYFFGTDLEGLQKDLNRMEPVPSEALLRDTRKQVGHFLRNNGRLMWPPVVVSAKNGGDSDVPKGEPVKLCDVQMGVPSTWRGSGDPMGGLAPDAPEVSCAPDPIGIPRNLPLETERNYMILWNNEGEIDAGGDFWPAYIIKRPLVGRKFALIIKAKPEKLEFSAKNMLDLRDNIRKRQTQSLLVLGYDDILSKTLRQVLLSMDKAEKEEAASIQFVGPPPPFSEREGWKAYDDGVVQKPAVDAPNIPDDLREVIAEYFGGGTYIEFQAIREKLFYISKKYGIVGRGR